MIPETTYYNINIPCKFWYLHWDDSVRWFMEKKNAERKNGIKTISKIQIEFSTM